MKVAVAVKPGARLNAVRKRGETYIVYTTKPPHNGQANKAVIELLANHFGVAKSRVSISRGLKSGNKLINILK